MLHVLVDLVPLLEVSPRNLKVRSDIAVDQSNLIVGVELKVLVENPETSTPLLMKTHLYHL